MLRHLPKIGKLVQPCIENLDWAECDGYMGWAVRRYFYTSGVTLPRIIETSSCYVQLSWVKCVRTRDRIGPQLLQVSIRGDACGRFQRLTHSGRKNDDSCWHSIKPTHSLTHSLSRSLTHSLRELGLFAELLDICRSFWKWNLLLFISLESRTDVMCDEYVTYTGTV